MARPDHLPDFDDPPLVEVAISTQFPCPPGYQNIEAGEVWALFKDRFPKTQEEPYIPPSFEIFGAPTQPNFPFNFSSFSLPIRYWFTHPEKPEIIQFQPDRFIHNWRKVGDEKGQYPHFDQIADTYIDDLNKLDAHFRSKGWGPIHPNQCELTYVNQLPLVDECGQLREKSFYLKNADMSLGEEIEFTIKIKTIIKGKDQKPVGRLSIDANTSIDAAGKPSILLVLVARGNPPEPTIPGAFEFLSNARNEIVTTFTQITTDEAHKLWVRTK